MTPTSVQKQRLRYWSFEVRRSLINTKSFDVSAIQFAHAKIAEALYNDPMQRADKAARALQSKYPQIVAALTDAIKTAESPTTKLPDRARAVVEFHKICINANIAGDLTNPVARTVTEALAGRAGLVLDKAQIQELLNDRAPIATKAATPPRSADAPPITLPTDRQFIYQTIFDGQPITVARDEAGNVELRSRDTLLYAAKSPDLVVQLANAYIKQWDIRVADKNGQKQFFAALAQNGRIQLRRATSLHTLVNGPYETIMPGGSREQASAALTRLAPNNQNFFAADQRVQTALFRRDAFPSARHLDRQQPSLTH